MPASNATSRFSDRVENYIRYRPDYPPEALALLRNDCGLAAAPCHRCTLPSVPGIWTRHFLENGNTVFGIEPNADMRQAGERLLAAFSTFSSIAGSAEKTMLPNQSVNFVTAAQAAHWFDRAAARQEFVRILKPGGWLVFYGTNVSQTRHPFLREYEQLLLTYGTTTERFVMSGPPTR